MKKELTSEEVSRYENLFTSFVNAAIVQTEGVAKEMNIMKSRLGVTTLKTKNIHIYFDGNSVSIDLFVSVIYGFSVPETVGEIQEKIIKSIKSASDFEIKSVNVHVQNVIFT